MYEGKRKENLMYGTGSAADRVLRAGNDRMGRGNGDTGRGCGRRDHNTGESRPELRSIKLPAGLKSIDSFAFNACSGLTGIEIPAGVTSLGNGAFYDCHGLKEIKIPAGLTSIAYDAFVSCTSLMNITVDENNPAYLQVQVHQHLRGCICRDQERKDYQGCHSKDCKDRWKDLQGNFHCEEGIV